MATIYTCMRSDKFFSKYVLVNGASKKRKLGSETEEKVHDIKEGVRVEKKFIKIQLNSQRHKSYFFRLHVKNFYFFLYILLVAEFQKDKNE